jgi:hypothetical protein
MTRMEGRRRLDKVVSPEFSADLCDLPIEEIRRRRRIAEMEEIDLSYLRRLIQGRMDIVRSELASRNTVMAHDDESIVRHLAAILADERGSELGRFVGLSEPSRTGEHRRRVEALVADPRISNVESRTPAELEQALEILDAHEREISKTRRDVQRIIDQMVAEIAKRAHLTASQLPRE